MKTISVANQKGGCGKTTTAINLSSALASLGKRVLLIDLDPQSHASFGLGVTNQTVNKSIYNVLTDNSDKRCPINECILQASKNLDVAVSNILLSTLEQELKDKEDAVSKLHNVITASDLNYDYIIVDCPPSLGFLTFNALRAADLVLVPIDMSAFSLMGVAKLLGMLELIKVKINHAPKVNSLATIFDKRTKYSETMLNEIRALFKDQMLQTIIRMNVTLKRAAAKGVSVIEFDKECNGAIDHLSLAKELMKEDEEEMLRIENSRAMMAIASTQAQETEKPSSDNTAQIIEDAVKKLAKEIVFAINAPNAREIYLVGDFNQWKIDDRARLSRSEGGLWEKRLGLTPGKYRYKFVVDGEWVIDSQNSEREQNMFGTFDSVAKL
ncbi:MAG: AAA family ATPase [Candidatus Omnitrophica bacterium]|nr:AAA family ATPase [Candidatus Omnitrophota bacterium]